MFSVINPDGRHRTLARHFCDLGTHPTTNTRERAKALLRWGFLHGVEPFDVECGGSESKPVLPYHGETATKAPKYSEPVPFAEEPLAELQHERVTGLCEGSGSNCRETVFQE